MNPIENRVVILPIPEEDTLFITPDSARQKPMRGEVVAAGEGVKKIENGSVVTIPMTCKVGDIVAYSKFGGTDVQIDGVDYVVMRETEVLCII